MLLHLHLTLQHWASVRPYTSFYNLAKSCVFSKQSPPLFLCHLYLKRHSFSRSYRSILPSSLRMINLKALIFKSTFLCRLSTVLLNIKFSWSFNHYKRIHYLFCNFIKPVILYFVFIKKPHELYYRIKLLETD